MTAVYGEIQFTKFPLHAHLQFFCFFSEHIGVAAFDYHSNLFIILDIFRKKTTLQHLFVPHGCTTSANLRQFVIIRVC